MDTQTAIRSVLDSLRRLVRELRLSSCHAHAAFGLTAAQLFVLERVAAAQPLSVNALAELTFTHQSSVSVVAHRLVQRGFLLQRPAPADRRRKELTITPRGKNALRRAPTSLQDRLIAAAAAMNPRDRRDLARLLAALIASVGLQDSHPVLFFEKEPPRPPRRARRTPPPKSAPRRTSP